MIYYIMYLYMSWYNHNSTVSELIEDLALAQCSTQNIQEAEELGKFNFMFNCFVMEVY